MLTTVLAVLLFGGGGGFPAADPPEMLTPRQEQRLIDELARDAVEQTQAGQERPTVAAETVGEPWLSLAVCESGMGGVPRWGYNGGSGFDGGLQFLPATWEWVAGDLGILEDYPYAYEAPPLVQVEVAEETQRRQGWEAWPVCSRKVGLR